MSISLKSILSLVVLAQVILALYSMLEIMGREGSTLNPRILRRVHFVNGYLFIVLWFVLTYYCLPYLRITRGEISARVLWHSLFAIGVLLMFIVKILLIRRYKKFMSKVPALGLIIFFLSVGLIATSGGYYFVTSAEMNSAAQDDLTKQTEKQAYKATVKKGKKLFSKWCSPCHYTKSKDSKAGPGLKDILKEEKLPVSKRAATPDNIRRQLQNPYMMMPAQTHLTDTEIEQIIEFLRTL